MENRDRLVSSCIQQVESVVLSSGLIKDTVSLKENHCLQVDGYTANSITSLIFFSTQEGLTPSMVICEEKPNKVNGRISFSLGFRDDYVITIHDHHHRITIQSTFLYLHTRAIETILNGSAPAASMLCTGASQAPSLGRQLRISHREAARIARESRGGDDTESEPGSESEFESETELNPPLSRREVMEKISNSYKRDGELEPPRHGEFEQVRPEWASLIDNYPLAVHGFGYDKGDCEDPHSISAPPLSVLAIKNGDGNQIDNINYIGDTATLLYLVKNYFVQPLNVLGFTSQFDRESEGAGTSLKTYTDKMVAFLNGELSRRFSNGRSKRKTHPIKELLESGLAAWMKIQAEIDVQIHPLNLIAAYYLQRENTVKFEENSRIVNFIEKEENVDAINCYLYGEGNLDDYVLDNNLDYPLPVLAIKDEISAPKLYGIVMGDVDTLLFLLGIPSANVEKLASIEASIKGTLNQRLKYAATLVDRSKKAFLLFPGNHLGFRTQFDRGGETKYGKTLITYADKMVEELKNVVASGKAGVNYLDKHYLKPWQAIKMGMKVEQDFHNSLDNISLSSVMLC